MQFTVGKARGRRRTAKPLTKRLVRLLWIMAALAGVAVFAVVIARITLRPVPGADGQVHHNPHPGATLRLYLDRPSVRAALMEVGGNLVLLMPLGVLLPVLSSRLRGTARLVVAVLLVSLGIEAAQGLLIEGRSFDVDDVILNTAGAVLAYALVGRRLARWARPS